jgi:undecaprenyl-diphosphatase
VPLALWKAIVLGIIEGLTEFLPVSSTGHLTIAEKLMHMDVSGPGPTAFTAIIQVGAIIAAILYFWRDIWRIIRGFVLGLFSADARRSPDWGLALFVIIGTIPIAIVGLALKHVIENDLRSLWIVAVGLIAWSAVMVFAEHAATQTRHEDSLRYSDAVVLGIFQVFSLIPGVSRSGATISGGLLRDIDRVTATRMSFLLGIPALAAAGGLEAISDRHQISDTVGWTPTIVALIVSFIVGYISIAWLLRFVARHSIAWFVPYRVALGVAIIIALVIGGTSLSS